MPALHCQEVLYPYSSYTSPQTLPYKRDLSDALANSSAGFPITHPPPEEGSKALGQLLLLSRIPPLLRYPPETSLPPPPAIRPPPSSITIVFPGRSERYTFLYHSGPPPIAPFTPPRLLSARHKHPVLNSLSFLHSHFCR